MLQNPTRQVPSSPVLTAALLAAGLVAIVHAWQVRQPLTTSDFTLFYRSAAAPAAEMYKPPPGPPRNNMNAPHFQLLLRPLTVFDLPAASAIFRAVSIVCALGCFWVIARTSREPWTLADAGALLAWTPVAVNISLNQITWIMLPLLVHAWWSWRRERWIAGAISYGIALSLKPFLGVFLLWLLITRRIRAAVVAVASAGFCLLAGFVVFGPDVAREWVAAMGNIVWWRSVMNGSVQGFVARILSPNPFEPEGPAWVFSVASWIAASIVLTTVWRTRRRTLEQSWAPLMASALLASPLGWVYYGCWLLPGRRPMRVLFDAPLLWIPVVFYQLPYTRLAAATYHARYFWGFLLIWMFTLFARDEPPAQQDAR